MKYLTLLLSIALFSCGQQKNAQDSATQEVNTETLLEKQNYVFKARSVSPTGGRTVQLNTDYSLRVGKDTLVSNLPYFGRAYSATIGSTNNALDFTSVDFEHIISPRKKGGWEIMIKPKDNQDVQQMLLTVFSGGSASLQVTSNNRQPISYDGVVIGK